MPPCVGLTGGIGSGKSSAARMFAELGADVVDTDQIAHELTQPGGLAIAALRDAFGAAYISEDGSLDRKKMRELAFSDPSSRRKLEAILHPLIRRRAAELVCGSDGPYVVLVVPLLLESGAYRELTDRVLVIDCDEALQVARAAARGGMDEASVRAVMAAQLPRRERLAGADDVIDNNGSVEALRRQVESMHVRYLALARGERVRHMSD